MIKMQNAIMGCLGIYSDGGVAGAEAIIVGFRNWDRVWWARFVAGLFITLGFIALIIPGILLAIRYVLIDYTKENNNIKTAEVKGIVKLSSSTLPRICHGTPSAIVAPTAPATKAIIGN